MSNLKTAFLMMIFCLVFYSCGNGGGSNDGVTPGDPPDQSISVSCSDFLIIDKNQTKNWQDAYDYCENQNLRLPTIDEFESLASHTDTEITCGWPTEYYWSSSEGPNGSYWAYQKSVVTVWLPFREFCVACIEKE